VLVDDAKATAPDKQRAQLVDMVRDRLRTRESVLAVFPFASTKKRPRLPGETRKDRVRIGVYQSYRRYRPLVLTDQRLFVFETGRTPHPRGLLAEFRVDDVDLVEVAPGRMGATDFVLELPGTGPVPFECGRKEVADLAVLRDVLGERQAGPSS
jgi:hypothetical protein